MMEARTYLIHIKQSLCPYMGIHMSQASTVILFHGRASKLSLLFQPRSEYFIYFKSWCDTMLSDGLATY